MLALKYNILSIPTAPAMLYNCTFVGLIAFSDIAAYCYTQSTESNVVCLSVDTFVSPAKTAEPIKMPFAVLTRSIWTDG